MKTCISLFLVLLNFTLSGQTFYFGNDLSYANMMEDCGAVFRENNQPKDVYRIFADHGTNLVRVRLWHNPDWQASLSQPAGVKPQYNDFDDMKESVYRSKQAGMQVMLDIHFSDFWADPGRQVVPASWVDVAADTAVLSDSVYNYVYSVLDRLNQDSLMPELVKIGNENNGGIMRYTVLNEDFSPGGLISNNWTRDAQLFNAAIRAVRDISMNTSVKPGIVLHYAGLNGLSWWYQNLINKGVTDFDIIGFSYYYAWHNSSIANMGTAIRSLKTAFPQYDVMVAETGYLWSIDNFDQMGNIISSPDPAYLPVTPEKQLEYMVDYTREVMRSGGIGIVFWAPEWVSTPCRTPWGQGSSHDHVAFFDPVNTNFMENGAGNWPMSPYYENLNTKKVTFRVDMSDENTINGVYLADSLKGQNWRISKMTKEGQDKYYFFTYLAPGDSGFFCFLNDSSLLAREIIPDDCSVNGFRSFQVEQNNQVYAFDWGSCSEIAPPGKVNVHFKVDMTGQDVSDGVWITGSMTGSPWKIMPMTSVGDNVYWYKAVLSPLDTGAYYFMNDNVWGEREHVPSSCATWWGSDRGYRVGYTDTVYAFQWGTCNPIEPVTSKYPKIDEKPFRLINLKNKQTIRIQTPELSDKNLHIKIFDISGKIVGIYSFVNAGNEIDIRYGSVSPGVYVVSLDDGEVVRTIKIVL